MHKNRLEGAEREVLRGAERILETWRPNIIIEILHENMAAIRDFVIKHGYEMEEIAPGSDPPYHILKPL